MPLAGMGFGAARELEQILAERFEAEKLAALIAEREQQAQLERERLNETRLNNKFDRERTNRLDAERTAEKAAAGEAAATERRGLSNMAGVMSMGLDPQTAKREIAFSARDPKLMMEAMEPPQAPKLRAVTVRGPKGEPINRMVPETESVVEYREPKTPTPKGPDYQRVVVDGKETFLTPEEVRARGGVEAASRKRAATGMERQTLGFYNRMKDALDTMDSVEDQLSERDVMLINDSPLPNLINNRLLSAAGQQYAQALATYTEARLRKESGAAIPESEFASDRKAISRQANDKPDVKGQKRQTRRRTMEGIGFAAGPAYEDFYGEPFQRMQDFSVKAPDGKTYTFKSAEDLAAFKKAAGIP